MTVNCDTYCTEKDRFFKKHKHDFNCQTSPMDESGRYHKEYVFRDGAIWYEVMSPEMVKQEIEIKLCKMTIEVKMFRIEFWNSDNAVSRYYYEKF